uniref:Uncharacterized protein n=1 Tax=Anguilla anguilla TaxID=7936 RepID=A0A0E9PE24_ANGAN
MAGGGPIFPLGPPLNFGPELRLKTRLISQVPTTTMDLVNGGLTASCSPVLCSSLRTVQITHF